MKGVKFIICDLDGTIIDNESKLSLQNIVAIQKLLNLDYRFILATGRNIERCLPILKQIYCKYQDFVICLNGAAIYDMKEVKYVYQNKLSTAALKSIVALSNDFEIEIFSYNANYNDRHFTGKTRSLLYKSLSKTTKNPILYFEKKPADLEVWKLKVYNKTPNMQKFLQKLKPLNLTCFKFNHHENDWYEISPPNTNKVIALKFLAREHNIKPEEVMCIGDNNNDLEMLKWAGIGVWLGLTKIKISSNCNIINWKSDPSKTANKIYKFLTTS